MWVDDTLEPQINRPCRAPKSLPFYNRAFNGLWAATLLSIYSWYQRGIQMGNLSKAIGFTENPSI